MDTQRNPYAPPQSNELATSLLLPGESSTDKRRRLAIVLFSFSVTISMLFTLMDDAVAQMRIGPWPVIFGSAILSIASSFITKDLVFAPLSCFGAVMGCVMVVAMTHSLQYAQLHLALPIACTFSLPALIIAPG